MEKAREFEHRSLQDGVSIGGYLQALAQGFAQGRLTFGGGEGGPLEVHPASLLEFSLRIESVGDRRRLVLTTEWSEKGAGPDSQPLEIGL
jgi:amphi-Trp domain-containing protein